jgi:hypothetical protein
LADGIRPLVINKRTRVTVFGGASKIVDRPLHAVRYAPESGWLVVPHPLQQSRASQRLAMLAPAIFYQPSLTESQRKTTQSPVQF